MNFSYKWITEYLTKKITPEKMAEILSEKSFEVESVAKIVDDSVLDISILPNRPDALSHYGIAREVAAITNSKLKTQNSKVQFKTKNSGAVKVDIQNRDDCLRYSALVMRGVTVGPSPKWLKERLELLGLKSVNNIVDATNYVMLELGQPLHAFDLKKIKGVETPSSGGDSSKSGILALKSQIPTIVIRRARKGERIKTLDDARTEYALGSSVLVIADSQRPIAIAGIKGGLETAIDNGTTDILVESANFSSAVVYRASRELGLRTDASVRFSYGIHPTMTVQALSRVAELVKSVAGGTTDKEIIDSYVKKGRTPTIILSPAYVSRLLGEAVPVKDMSSILKRLGCTVTGATALRVVSPEWRLDLVTPEDLIEEIGRVYGYGRITSQAPQAALFDERAWVKEDTGVPWDSYEFIRERNFIMHLLAGIGFSEVYNYSLIPDDFMGLFDGEQLSEVAYPMSREYRYLRQSLLPRMLLNVRNNFRFFEDVRIAEVGHVFLPGKEPRRLSVVLAQRNGNDLFFELKGLLQVLFHRIGVVDVWYDDAQKFSFSGTPQSLFAEGRTAHIRTEDGRVLGVLGSVSVAICGQLKVKGAVAASELDLEALIAHFQQEREFEPLPKFPAVVRDISMLVHPSVTVNRILEAINRVDSGEIIEDVDVFDIYEPSSREVGAAREAKTSVAFHVIYRSKEHTLTDAEVDAVEKKIRGVLERELGAKMR